MFVVMSLQTVAFPFARNEFRLRQMLKDFVVPSLIVTAEDAGAAVGAGVPSGEGSVRT